MTDDRSSITGIEALPNELLVSIIEQILSRSVKDIRSLSLTSHRMHVLSLDYLYNRILISRPLALIRTLSHNPELAARVRQVTWNPRNDKTNISENQEDLVILGTGIDSARNTEKKQPCALWHQHESFNVLTMHTPNLDTLTVKHTHAWIENMYRFEKIGSSATHLDNLHTVHCDGPLCMEQTGHLFLLP